MTELILGLMILSLIIWLCLILFWGQFWRVDQQLQIESSTCTKFPTVCIIVPARNEAEVITVTLRSLLLQDYPGNFQVLLVDDQSTDETASLAVEISEEFDQTAKLKIIVSKDLPPGWTGKLWAMEQGFQQINQLYQNDYPDYILFTDADIEHHISNLSQLVNKAETDNLDLVSLMVKLRCQSFWEQLLIPAFVFFFQKLYPFRWVNNPEKATAAAAGGCILINREMLTKIGGLSIIKTALIDDCSLAEAVKSHQGKIWLGLTSTTSSLRPYESLQSIWNMVARTAYTQLYYSPFLLVSSVLGMVIVYILPILGIFLGLLLGNWLITLLGLCTWLLMIFAYFPIIFFYQVPLLFTLCLPIIALFYTCMTIDSAKRHWQGVGGAWKGRFY
ncbi:MAG: glycosyltransferase [Sphaerospermopsis sp. SIO1G1]|nr:glycosyltransferase [Sphaerospermopsis sp. SIO1G1]